MRSSTSKRLRVTGESIHVEHAGHDLVNGVERRPHPLAGLETIPPCRGEGAEVRAAQPLLALGQLRHHESAFDFTSVAPVEA